MDRGESSLFVGMTKSAKPSKAYGSVRCYVCIKSN